MVSFAHRTPRVVVVSASVGAGHDGAAAEIAARLTARGCAVERYDFIDLVPPPMGRIGRKIYQMMIESMPSSWDFVLSRLGGSGQEASRFADSIVRMTTTANRRLLRAIGSDATAVLSTYPLASQALGQLRATGGLQVPAVTFLTDMSVHPLWVHRGIDAHLALHDIAAAQARSLGGHDVHVVAPAVRQAFAPLVDTAARREMRTRFGLPRDSELALVVAGSWGVGAIEQAVAEIAATGLVTPVIACGRNAALHRRLTKADLGIPLGWTSDMPALINACDVVIQNAGGLTSLEALATGVPVLTYRCLPGHGRTNAEALDQTTWVPWVRTRDDLAPALRRALATRARINPFAGTDVSDAVLALVNPKVLAAT